MTFIDFKKNVAAHFDEISKGGLYRTAVDKDELWATYLASFPPGTNPHFRKRTVHDCSCCRQFVRSIGNAVAIINGELVSVWDVATNDPVYSVVAKEMAKLVKAKPVVDIFLHYERSVGTDQNYERKEGEAPQTWDHFFVTLPRGRNSGRDLVCAKKDIDTRLGEVRSTFDVFLRGLTELTMDAVDTVLELIKQNSLYRGTEYLTNLEGFRALKVRFDKLAEKERENFVWSNVEDTRGAVSRIRNTAIGTLLIDLSAGVDLEDAVKKFETSIMAPTNYKRPTALVTQAMVDAARKAVDELGLTSALERRYAQLPDITVNNVLFADRSIKKVLRKDAFDEVAVKRSSTPKSLSKVETMPIEKFIADVLPNIDSMEMLFENSHTGNLMSLIAPSHPDAKPLFKWGNNFSWSYNGDVTDSIKERVKKAGGNVTGDLCCRLAWSNYDDLDFHLTEPGKTRKARIAYYSKTSPAGGRLDVDANAGGGGPGRGTREPVENIFYGDRRRMCEGRYKLEVNQYSRMETVNFGFEVEIDYLGTVTRYAYTKAMRTGEFVTVAEFDYTHSDGVKFISSLPSTTASRNVWGLATNEFHPVNVMMLSPNYWNGESIGNRHYIFALDRCKNDGQARGFFNEFLRPDLDKHRKVIEMVGSKMKVAVSDNQLSGLGFSDTKRSEVLIRVKGNFTRTLKVTI